MQGKLIVKNNILICDINGVEIGIGYCINRKIEQFRGQQSERIIIEYEPCRIEPIILAGDNEMKLFAGVNYDSATEITFRDVEKLKLLL